LQLTYKKVQKLQEEAIAAQLTFSTAAFGMPWQCAGMPDQKFQELGTDFTASYQEHMSLKPT
jgi:hypothetical protein